MMGVIAVLCLKIVAKRFGGNRKSRTFASPFEMRTAVKAESS